MEPKEKNTPAGVGPGITGASGEMIEGTGRDRGVGGTGHDDEADAAGMRRQDQYTARPDEQQADADTRGGATHSTRLSGSQSGGVGGGGPNAAPSTPDSGDGRPGGGGGGALGDVPGGIRNVSPANDNATDPDHIREGQGQNRSERTNHIRAGNPGTDDEH
jgi:hypothetical protein